MYRYFYNYFIGFTALSDSLVEATAEQFSVVLAHCYALAETARPHRGKSTQ
jgi:hypothetical protein